VRTSVKQGTQRLSQLRRSSGTARSGPPGSGDTLRPVSGGERTSTLTVLFTDLVGSTALMAMLGEVPFNELRRQHFSQLAGAVAADGGTLVKTTGDGVIAVFPSAVDAVRCAVAIQQLTERQARGEGVALTVRVALTLGEVSVEENDVFGGPVIEAARLVDLADGGSIVVTGLVRAVTGSRAGVHFDEAGPVSLRGLPEPVPTFLVSWGPMKGDIPFPALLAAAPRVDFVGRGSELADLRRRWDAAADGHRQAVLLAGEPGVGKTRLAAELARTVHTDGAIVLAGRCDEGLGVPYQPFVEALRHLVGHTSRSFLVPRLGRLAGELTRLLPDIADAIPGLPPPLRSDPETERYRLFDAVAAWLAATSRTDPVLLVLDDLQWAARPTLLLLRHVMRSLEPMRVLVVGTYRDTELDRDHPLAELLADLRPDPTVDRLPLHGLDPEGVAAFMRSASGHQLAAEDVDVVRAVHAETQGNPFFVGEVLHHVAESGGLYRLGRGRPAARVVEALGIPEGVREVVRRRLARLSPAANRVLSLGALAGEEFDLTVLGTAGNFEEETLVSAIDEAIRSRLVDEDAQPLPRYRFTHALVRATLSEDVSAGHRALHHRRLGEAIEAVHADRLDDHLSALAYHFCRAHPLGQDTRAVGYAKRAGDAALELLAHDQAVAHFEQALEVLERSDITADENQTRLRCDVLIGLGEAQRRIGDARYRETLLEAARLAADTTDAGRLTAATLANHRGFFSLTNEVDTDRVAMLEAALAAVQADDSELRARLLVTLAGELVFSPEHDRRHHLVSEALEIARRTGSLTTLGDVLARGYVPTFTTLDIGGLQQHTKELAEVAERLEDPALAFWASTWGFMTTVLIGDLGAAEQLIARSTAIADGLGQPFFRWIATFGRAHLGRILGRLEEAEATAWESLELGRAAGAPDAFGMFGIQLFWIRYDQGRLDEVLPMFDKTLSRRRRAPLPLAAYALALCEVGRRDEARPIFDELAATGFAMPFAWIFAATILAEVAAALGDVDGCRVLYEGLRPHHRLMATNGAATTGPVAHFLGLLAAQLGRQEASAGHFEEAMALEERLGASVFLARTRREYHRVLGSNGAVPRVESVVPEPGAAAP
jgi:class 3 adenylate cyclase/tetratricopeptide (TPR) repeat protein